MIKATKLISGIVAASMLFCSTAFAASVDISSMSTNELKDLQQQIAMQLYPKLDGTTEMVDNETVKISITGVAEGTFGTTIGLLVENKTDKAITILCDSCTINDWTVTTLGAGEVAANANLKGEFTIVDDIGKLGIASINEITSIGLVLNVVDANDYSTIFTSDTLEYSVIGTSK